MSFEFGGQPPNVEDRRRGRSVFNGCGLFQKQAHGVRLKTDEMRLKYTLSSTANTTPILVMKN
jgi:hypothetical protein